MRTTLELSVLGVGFTLGGTVGLGTVVYALSIGPLVQLMLPRLIVDLAPPLSSSAPGLEEVPTLSA